MRGGRTGPSTVPGRRGRGARARPPALLAALAGLVLLAASGCGGGTRQDAHEPQGTFALRVTHASFPALQTIARQTKMQLQVRNVGATTVPNVAVTIDSFDYNSTFPGLSDKRRPVWVIERGPGLIAVPPVETQEISNPGGAVTAYVNTWALGSLAPGRTATFAWGVVPVKSGIHTVSYTVAAGLAGKAKVRRLPGTPTMGRFLVHIAAAPPPRHVNPETGRVEPGRYPLNP